MGRSRRLRSVLVAAVAGLFGVGAQAEKLIVQADTWCPVNCEPGAHHPGFLVDLATQIFGEAGITVEYLTSSWTHAIEDVRQGEAGALIGAGKLDAPDFIFGKVPAGFSRQCFYTHSDVAWHYAGIASLKDIRLGVINGYSYGDEIDEYIRIHRHDDDRVQTVSGTQALETNLRKIKARRIGAIVENSWVMAAHLAENGAGLISAGCRSPDVPIYLAFSPVLESSARYSDIFDDGLRRYRANGRLADIMQSYGIHGSQ